MQEPALFVREGDRIVPAPAEDAEVAQSYAEFADKGVAHGGFRLSILARGGQFAAGEEVHVIHVCEAMEAGTRLYVMGPKRVYGEFVDGVLTSDPPPNPNAPLEPVGTYDGRVVPGPGVDTNYEITRYRFESPGIHTICWRLGELSSNVLRIVVRS